MQEHEGDARIQASVNRMQAVIEAGRLVREKNNRTLKQPVRKVTVVHPDPDFLADITGQHDAVLSAMCRHPKCSTLTSGRKVRSK